MNGSSGRPRLRWLAPFVVVAAGAALYLPSLAMGFYADDYTYLLVLEGPYPAPKPVAWNLYDFGSAADWTYPSGELEALPWWTSPDWKIRFFRPLTSASLALDHAIFGSRPAGYHAMSLAWYALLLALVHRLYRRLGLGRETALLSLALYACTSSASMPVGWIANRNSTLAAALTVGALLCVVRGGAPWARWRAPAALLLALLACLAKESGVTAFALTAAWLGLEARRATDPEERRAAWRYTLLGLAAGVIYVILLAVAGFGTRCVFYATPWTDPQQYLARLGILLTAGLLRLVFPLSLDLQMVLPGLAGGAVLAGALVAGALAVALVRRLRDRPDAAFLLAWLLLSLGVEGGAPASDRVLLSAAVGSAGLLGTFISASLQRAAPGAQTRTAVDRSLAWTLLVSAGVLSAAFAVMQSAGMTRIARETRDAALGSELGPATEEPREALILQSSAALLPFSLPAMWIAETGDRELRIRPLQMGRRGIAWSRQGEDAFLLRSLDEPFLTHLMEGVFLSEPGPPAPGTRWRTPAFEAEAVEVDGTGLRTIRFRLRRALDDPTVRFLADRDGRLVSIPPPADGETVILPRAEPRDPLTL